jgi:hypothetical protein
MSEFSIFMIVVGVVALCVSLPDIISAYRFGNDDLSPRQLRKRLKRGDTYTVKCPCKGHPFKCFNHPNDCGCSTQGEESK